MSKMESEICPICDGMLSYGPANRSYGHEEIKWKCDKCGTTGTEVRNTKFAFHQNVKDVNGNPVQIVPLYTPQVLFWVTWIEQDSQRRVCKCGVNESPLVV